MAQYEKKQHLSYSFQLNKLGEEIYNNEINTKYRVFVREMLSHGEIKQGEFNGMQMYVGR